MTDSRRRSTRFPLEFPALLRWQAGRLMKRGKTQTKNISRSSLYLLVDKTHAPSSKVEFEVELPPPPTGGFGALLRGKGHLVRREDVDETQTGVVAVIERYEFITTSPPGASEEPTKPSPRATSDRTPSKKSSGKR